MRCNRFCQYFWILIAPVEDKFLTYKLFWILFKHKYTNHVCFFPPLLAALFSVNMLAILKLLDESVNKRTRAKSLDFSNPRVRSLSFPTNSLVYCKLKSTWWTKNFQTDVTKSFNCHINYKEHIESSITIKSPSFVENNCIFESRFIDHSHENPQANVKEREQVILQYLI